MRNVAVVVLLLGAVLAGCSSPDGDEPSPPAPPPPSPAVHAVREPDEVWVTSTQDGKRLHNAVYRPDTGERVPVFINFSPYWGDSALAGGDNFAQHLVREYVPRGFAVVLSAVRGTGHSEGCFQIGGDLELRDAYDVVDHFASEPWSNGRVAAGGKSYDSTTQNGLVAKFPHPALAGIFHVSGITDMYRYNYREGVPYRNGLEFTPRYFLSQGLDEYGLPGVGTGSPDDEGPESLARLLDDVACVEFPRHVASGEGSAATGMKDAYWQERDWNRDLPDSPWNGSVFFVHGLQDWNVKPDHILPWLETLQQKGVPLLAWLHQDTENGGHVYPMRADWNETMLAWLDWTLKGADNGFAARLGIEVEGSDGLWRRYAAWPAAPERLLGAGQPASGTGGIPAPANGTMLQGMLNVTVAATTTLPNAVLTMVAYDVGGPQDVWVTEAVASAFYPDTLDLPGLPSATARTYRFLSYPFEHALAPGHMLEFRFGAEPREVVVTQAQLDAVTYGDRGVGYRALPGLEAPEAQPEPTPCWAC